MLEFIKKTAEDQTALERLKVNLADLNDDGSDYSKVVVKKPWGYEYLLWGDENLAVWILFIAAGAETSMHCHPRKLTSLTVLKGEVEFRTLDQRYRKKAGEALLIEKETFHQTFGTSKDGAYIMEIETPNIKRDLIRLRDKYGRENQGYEDSSAYSINTQNYNYISFKNSSDLVTRKRLGECALTICNLTKGQNLSELFAMQANDIACLLKGKLQTAAQIGHAFSAENQQIIAEEESCILIARRSDPMIKVSDYVAETLKQLGVTEVFLTPGDANVHLLDSIGRCEGLRFIALPSEREAALAAEGYAKSSGKLAVLVLSSGISVPNATAGIANCFIDSAPLLVLAGQSRSDQSDSGVRQLGNKALNALELTKSITKLSSRVNCGIEVGYKLTEAAAIATSGRPGPVLLELPIDIQGAEYEIGDYKCFKPPYLSTKENSETLDLTAVITALRNAERPVILIGNGARAAKGPHLDALLSKLKAPVLLSRRGADLLPHDHPLNFGRPGTYGTRAANLIIQNSDLLLCLGCRQSIPLIGRNTEAFARGAKKIVVDIDPAEIQKSTIKSDLSFVSDASDFIEKLTSKILTLLSFDSWIAQAKLLALKYPSDLPEYAHKESINPYGLLREISERCPNAAQIVIDGGPIMHRAMQVFNFKGSQNLVCSTGLEAPGFALAGAIGAAILKPKTPVICLVEDRGFQSCIQTLQTILDFALDIRVIVLRSKGSAGIRHIQRDFFGGRYVGTDGEIRMSTPPIHSIGALFGLNTSLIETPPELTENLIRFLETKGPSICEIAVDSEQELIPRMAFKIKPDGKWLAKPLEEMYPFLPREEIQKQLKIPLLQED